MTKPNDFSRLTPNRLVTAVEQAVGRPFVGFAHPLPSYINRVYELQDGEGTRLIAKFYRPGRWTRAAIEAEHRFVHECAADEIPVVAPLPLASGGTIGDASGILFAVYAKCRGREFEPVGDEDWRRLGRVVARLHAVGARAPAPARVTLRPDEVTREHVRRLLDGGFVGPTCRKAFEQVCTQLLTLIAPLFTDAELIRIHGDCNRGNVLERPETGLVLIDFDDMAMGPPVQDLWMLLPDRADRCPHEIELMLEGYGMFRRLDRRSLRLIEPLRAMRLLHFAAWCSRQVDDPAFTRQFPNWGSDAYWKQQAVDLYEQLEVIVDQLTPR